MSLRALGLVALLVLVPAAAAQEHAHGEGGPVRLVTHLADPAVTFVGSMNGFTALAVGDDDVPDFHQDLPMRITLNGEVLFETDADAGHDYDGVQTVWIVFPRAGAFLVEALAADGAAAASLAGTVLEPPSGAFGYAFNGGTNMPWGVSTAEVTDDGRFDAWADVRNGDRLLSTATLHAEDGTLAWAYTPQGPNVALSRPLLFAARPDANDTRPGFVFGSSFAFVNAGVGQPGVDGWLAGSAALPTDSNAVIDVTGDGLRLLGTYDPWTRVGTETLQSLAILGLDANGHLVDDLRLQATLAGPHSGVAWSSSDILERDGVWEFSSIQGQPGLYVLHAEATSAAGSASIDLPYLVAPPSDPSGAGPITLDVDVPAEVRAGEPVQLTVRVTDALDAPFDHSEVLLDVFGPYSDEAVTFADGQLQSARSYTLRAKLHTHADGLMRVTYAFPAAGDYTLWLSPSSLEARPVAIGGAPLAFAAKTVQVQVLPAAAAAAAEGQDASAPTAALAMLALAGLAWVARRR